MSQDKARILVAEDSPVQRETLIDTLSGAGFEVLAAENGKLGLELAKAQLPDLIISDVQMPEMDGVEFCRAVQADPTLCQIPVLFRSSLDSLDDVVRGMAAGAADYLSKKTDGSEQMLTTINEYLVVRKRSMTAGTLARLDAGMLSQLPGTFFEKQKFGVLVANLRRNPIYANAVGRQLLGLPVNLAEAELTEFKQFMASAASRFVVGSTTFFTPMEWKKASIHVHIGAIHDFQMVVCGVMVMVRPGACV